MAISPLYTAALLLLGTELVLKVKELKSGLGATSASSF